MPEIFHLYPNYNIAGGGEKMIQYLHKKLPNLDSYWENSNLIALNSKIQPCSLFENDIILGLTPRLILKNKDNLWVSHHRKVTSILFWASKILSTKLNIVHIAHSEFHNLKPLTFLPKKVVAVSKSVKNNLITEFKVEPTDIELIYNGCADTFHNSKPLIIELSSPIKIVYPARIISLKQQLLLVKLVQSWNIEGIEITFLGDGEQLAELKALCEGDKRFKVLGHVDSIYPYLQESHFTMLYSTKEGLSISLIESAMHAKALIVNNVGGNAEIAGHENGFICQNDEDLRLTLLGLSSLTNDKYLQMSNNSRAAFIEHFDSTHMLNHYNSYLKSVIEQ